MAHWTPSGDLVSEGGDLEMRPSGWMTWPNRRVWPQDTPQETLRAEGPGGVSPLYLQVGPE